MRVQDLPPFISRQEVARYFPGIISPGTLARLASEGKGPPYFRMGKRAFYDTKELVKWLKERAIRVKTIEDC